jgi:flagellar hook-associated protein 2
MRSPPGLKSCRRPPKKVPSGWLRAARRTFSSLRRRAVKESIIATITSLGVGSGLDLNTIVDKLTALERQPLNQLKKTAADLQTQVSSYGKMQSLFSTLQSSSNALTNASLWTRSLATSSSDSAVGVVGGNGAAAGQYAVQVEQLAQSQTLASGTVYTSATALVGSGTLTLELGAYDAATSSFVPKDGATAVDISVSATDTLQTLRDKINASGAGVTASLVTDTSGVRLALRSSNSGAENGFRVGATETDSGGLGRLAYDPGAGTPAATDMQLKLAGSNARATINGIELESASNTIAGAVEGLTLNLRQVTTDPVNVAVSKDTESVAKAIKTFAEAYNSLASYIAEQTKYDATSKSGGPLQGDGTANGLMGRMRAILNNPSGASSAFAHLSDVGLSITRNGNLNVDDAKLASATDNLVELKKAFANSDPLTPANEGFARRYAALATSVLGVDGTVTTRSDGLRKLINKNSDDQTKVNDRADRFQARLVAQYQAMDASVAKLNSLQSYVTQQIAQMNKTTN